MKRYLSIISCCLFFMNSFSQKKLNQPIVDSALNEVQLNEVVLAVSKFPEYKRNIAQQVQVLGAKKMQFMNQPTTAELLTQSGSVLVQKSQLGGGSPVIRGFEANKILIVVDGVRMNNAIFRGGHLQNVLTIDNSVLDKTEILFGPSSLVYGSDALGGVMSFTTKNPVLSLTKKQVASANGYVRYASAYDEKTGHIDFSFGDNKFASLSSITYSDFGDLVQGSNYYSKYPNWGKRTFFVERINGADYMIPNKNVQRQVQTNYHQYDIMQKFLFKTGKFSQVLNFQYSNTGNIYRYDRLTETNSAGIAKNAQWYYGPQKRIMAQWAMSYGKTSIFDNMHTSLAYQDIEESRHNRGFNKSNLNHRTEKVQVVSFNADFNKVYPKGEVRYGAEVVFNKVGSAATAENIVTHVVKPLDTRYPDGGANTQSLALYVTNTNHLSDKLILNEGIRVSYNRLYSLFKNKAFFPFPFNDVTQRSISPTGNAGLVFLPSKSWKLSASFSTGFRTPNVDDLSKVFESGGGQLIIPNPDLKPERTFNYEVGISKSFAGKYLLDVNVWYTKYSNALATEAATLNGLPFVNYDGVLSRVIKPVNKDKAYLWGTSARFSADVTRHVSISSVINYTYGRVIANTGDTPLDHIAPLFGKTSVNGHIGKFRAEIFALYNGEKKSKNYKLGAEDNEIYSADPVNGYTPLWFTLNFRSSFAITKNTTVQFAVENITDKFYRVFASGLSAPGRNFVLSLRASL